PVVSRNFYAALQNAEGLGACNDAATTTEACLPSLTKSQIRGLLSAKITPADLVGVAAQGSAQPFRICRRANTSGTQQSFEYYFSGQGCSTSGALTFTFAPTPPNPSNGQPCLDVGCTFATAQIGTGGVFQGTGSGDVESCLDNADDNNVYAIGILSTDRVPN